MILLQAESVRQANFIIYRSGNRKGATVTPSPHVQVTSLQAFYRAEIKHGKKLRRSSKAPTLPLRVICKVFKHLPEIF